MNNTDIIENKLFKMEFEELINNELKYKRDGLFYNENYKNVLNGNVVINYKTFFGFINKKRHVSVDFKDGLIHGKLIFYDKDGNEYITSRFKHGVPDGQLVVISPYQTEDERSFFRPLESSLYEDGKCMYRNVSPPPGTFKVYYGGYLDYMKKGERMSEEELLNKENVSSYLGSEYYEYESRLENPLFSKSEKEFFVERMEEISEHDEIIIYDIIELIKKNTKYLP